MESGIAEGLAGIINKSMDCKKALVCLRAQALMLKNRIQGSKNLSYLCVFPSLSPNTFGTNQDVGQSISR